MHFLILVLYALLAFTPLSSVNAASTPTDFKSLMGSMVGIVNTIIPIIFGLIFISITWGVAKAWIMGEASQEDIERGKKVAIVGIIVLTVVSAIWGILRLLQSSLFG